MAWWTMAASAVSSNSEFNIFAWEGEKDKAFTAAWQKTHVKVAQKYEAEDRSRQAETNLAKVQSDRQVTLTEEANNDAIRKADMRLAMAVSGDSTMGYVGEAALAHKANMVRQDVNTNYDANLETELHNYTAAKTDFYALNQPFAAYERDSLLKVMSSGFL